MRKFINMINEGEIKKPMTPAERQSSLKKDDPEMELSPEEQETIDKGKEGEKILRQKGVLKEGDGSLNIFVTNYCANNNINFMSDLMDIYITENMVCSEDEAISLIKTVNEESIRFSPSNTMVEANDVYEIYKLPSNWNFQYGFRILSPRTPEHDGYEGKCYSLEGCKKELTNMGYSTI